MSFGRQKVGSAIVCCVSALQVHIAYSADLSANDLTEIRRVETALADETLPQPPGYWFNHAASDEGQQELERVGYPDSQTDLAAVVLRAGGWSKYKANVASLLQSKDVVVRGFVAIWLADLGDRNYAKNLFELLQRETPRGREEYFHDADREFAAEALGVLKAREYADKLVAYSKSENPRLRAGAAKGLGWMQAVDRHAEVAALLKDEDSHVAPAAILALARMGAKQYVPQLAALAVSKEPLMDQQVAAVVALVMMNAKDQSPILAKYLKDEDDSWHRGKIVQALALLDCRECASLIAELLTGDDDFLCGDAIVALGVLRDRKFAPQIAKYLTSKDRRLCQSAAWALIYMESQEHVVDAVKAYSPFDVQQSGAGINLPVPQRVQIERQFEAALLRGRQNVREKT